MQETGRIVELGAKHFKATFVVQRENHVSQIRIVSEASQVHYKRSVRLHGLFDRFLQSFLR
jgi:hypothetical protein